MLALMGVLFWYVPVQQVLDVFYRASMVWIGLVVILRCVNFLVSSLKLYVLLPKEPPINFLSILGIYLAGKFFGNFLPTSVGGDLVKIRELKIRNLTLNDASSIVFIERFSGVMGVFLIGLAVTFPGLRFLDPFRLQHFQLLFFGGGLLIFFLAGLIWSNLSSFEGLLNRQSWIPATRWFEKFISSLQEYGGRMWQIIYVLVISVGYHLIRCLYLYVSIIALGGSVEFFSLLPAIPIITIVSLIPISINNLGLREGAITFTFTALSLTTAEALGVALLTRCIGYFLSLIGGAYYLKRPGY